MKELIIAFVIASALTAFHIWIDSKRKKKEDKNND